MTKLEKLLPRCKTKDTHDFPDLKDGERCHSCELWEAIDQYADERVVEELEKVVNLGEAGYIEAEERLESLKSGGEK